MSGRTVNTAARPKKAAMGVLARAYLSRAYYGNDASYFTKARDMAKQVIDNQGALKVALKSNYADLWNSAAGNKGMGKAGERDLFVISNSLVPANNYEDTGNLLFQMFQTPYSGKPGLALSIEYGRDASTFGILNATKAHPKFFNEKWDGRFLCIVPEDFGLLTRNILGTLTMLVPMEKTPV